MKNLQQRIAEKRLLVQTIRADIAKLDDAMLKTETSGIVWRALFDKWFELNKQLPKAKSELERLERNAATETERYLSNRNSRRFTVESGMITNERVIPA